MASVMINGNTYMYSNGTISSGNGSVGVSAQNISLDATYGMPSHTCDELPAMTFNTTDENGRAVTMTLSPESDISSRELTKIFMLSLSMIHGTGGRTNSLAYVKKHNLERHFKYA